MVLFKLIWRVYRGDMEVYDSRIGCYNLSTLNGKYQDLLQEKKQLELRNASLWGQVDGEDEVRSEFARMLDGQQRNFDERVAALDARLDKMVNETDEEFAPMLRDATETKKFLMVKGFCYFLNKFKKSELLNIRLGTCISAAISDGIRQGLDVGFVRKKKGTDINYISAYNPYAMEVYVDGLDALNDVSFPLLEQIKACAEQPFSYLTYLLVMGVHESIQDEAETLTNLASGSTSSAGVTVESDDVLAGTASNPAASDFPASGPSTLLSPHPAWALPFGAQLPCILFFAGFIVAVHEVSRFSRSPSSFLLLSIMEHLMDVIMISIGMTTSVLYVNENRVFPLLDLILVRNIIWIPPFPVLLPTKETNNGRNGMLEEACTVTMKERCSTVLLNKLPSKEKDPRSFTIPCNIGHLHINNALADLGASISLMPYTMYEKLGLGEPKPTIISLELADRSIQYPREIAEKVLIKIDKFVLPINFVILDTREDSKIMIILGRPFLATARAMIDVFNKKITLRVENKEVIFDVDQLTKRPPTEDVVCYGTDFLDTTIHLKTQELLEDDQLDSFPVNNLEESIDLSNSENYGFFQIPITPEDQEKTTFTCPYKTFANKKMLFGLCNAPATFQRCTTAIFYDMVEDFMEVFMDDFAVFVKEGIVLGNKISRKGIKVDKAKIDVIAKLPYPSNVKGVRSFLGHVGFYRRFIKDFSMISKPMTQLLMKDAKFGFSEDWFFQIPITPEDQEKTTFTCPYKTFANKKMLFGLCNAPATFQRCTTAIFYDMVEDFMEVFMDDFAVFVKEGIVLGNKISRKGIKVDKAKIDVIAKLPYPSNVKGVRSFLGHVGFYRSKQDAKPRLIRWVLLIQGFNIDIKDKKGAENLVDDHLSRLENLNMGEIAEDEIADRFPDEHSMILKDTINNKSHEIEHKAYWALKQCNMDLTAAVKNHFMELNELMELRDGAYENTQIYKERTKRWHDSRLRGDTNFINGEKVLLFNSRLKLHPRKLKSKWYGPFVVKIMYPYGAVEITDKNGLSFKVNGQRNHTAYPRVWNTAY
uniref:Reverse transcriptase domain-containing protein n=1 Tax=Tanacetum cinerariifolium TaxID=118510 RepID=A0A6L2M7C8_TANCI|nr:hypothetical protein [Tanacetum cinerariifolium]